MTDLADGETVEVKGSAAQPYQLKNTGGVYSCSCPAWRNQSVAIERRTCKRLRALRGEAAEAARLEANPGATPAAAGAAAGAGSTAPPAPRAQAVAKEGAPPLLLAHSFDQLETPVDPTGWWLSEKLDGVRAWWDGTAFTSRLGNRYHAPPWFTAALPQFALDGELWVGRKQFQRTVSIVRRQDQGEDWRQVTFVVFDAPALEAPFEDRIEHCQGWFARHAPPHARHLEHLPCQGLAHLRAELKRVEELGGEGLMLRQPGSRYECGRSHTLLKVKSFFDAEARVVNHVPGAGRHRGRLGALEVEMPDGTRFHVGTGFSDAERSDPPGLGAVITYRYQELSTDGVPRFPSYVGLRVDIEWAGKDGATAPDPHASPVAAAGSPSAASVPATATAAAPAATGVLHRLVSTEDGASKFWEVALAGASLTVRYGRIGSAGQSKTTSCSDAAAAQAQAQMLIAQKLAKGYRAEAS